MPPEDGIDSLERDLEALQAAHPDLEPLAGIVLLAVCAQYDPGRGKGVNTALLAQRLDIEHALIRRAVTDLETRGWITAESAGGASPALRLVPTDERPSLR
ncbi:helix-turn-helix domain-containing protein [Salinisphaera sp. Q1T1-3]|uniref:MarR family transcriptional regulator n=1 Tax=Salinisphaera sp. Q1T1-3 TaxID=2321229 RepID=UPI000E70B357|nr:helix-turn-helix domain-containing protein [Salinisphaera sp. Q1T1-3]RJS91930.1 MarR family transcriptional regulator [Salinisphaera sp. Q1T1-3]